MAPKLVQKEEKKEQQDTARVVSNQDSAFYRIEVKDPSTKVKDAECKFTLAQTSTVFGKFDEAAQRFREALKLDPGFIEAHAELAIVLTKKASSDANSPLSQYEEAIFHFDKAEELLKAYYKKSKTAPLEPLLAKFAESFPLEAGKFAKFRKMAEDDAKLLRGNADLRAQNAAYDEATKALSGGNYVVAVQKFAETMELYKKSGKNASQLHLGRANAYLFLKKYAEAAADLEAALNLLKPDDTRIPQINYSCGNCYYQLKDYPKAIANYDEAIKLSNEGDPQLPQIYRQRGNAHDQLKEYAKSALDLEGALKLLKEGDSKIPGLYYDMGYSYYQLNQYEKAANAFESSIKQMEEGNALIPDVQQMLGYSYYNLKEYSKAAESLKAALSLMEEGDGRIEQVEKFIKICDQMSK